GNELMQHLHVLMPELDREPAHPRHVSSRPVEAGNEAYLDGIGTAGEDDRYRRRQRLGDQSRVVSADRRDAGDLASYPVGRTWPQLVHSIVRKAVIDRDIAALGVAGLVQALPKRLRMMGAVKSRDAAEAADGRHRLLRARRERPGGRAAEQRDELAAPHHVWMAPAGQEIIWRAAQRSLAVMCPACWCSPGGPLALMGSANRVLIIRTGSMSR